MEAINVLELPIQICTAFAAITASNTMLPANEGRDKLLSGWCFSFENSHHFRMRASDDLL